MLRRLYLNNCFTHQDREIFFDQGLTGVIGPNESGKSLIVEAVRYALFGSKALRGKADDYKKLHVELDFEVQDQAFTVIRKAGKATLSGDRDASGTKPVDQAIRDILGYDLSVFDVANACNQGNVEVLSEMKPTERKKMVDKTIGLDQLDNLIAFAGAEANALKREAAAMERGLAEPVEPSKPEDFRPSSEIQIPEAELAEYHQLAGWLQRAPARPVEPDPCPVTESIEELKTLVDQRNEIDRNIKALERERAGLKPETLGPEECNEIEANLDLWERWEQKQKLLARGYHECPSCAHQWPVADLGDLEDVEEPSIRNEVSRQELVQARRLHGNNDRIAGLDQGIAELQESQLADRSADLKAKLAHERHLESYQQALEAWERYNADLPQKQARAKELEGIEEKVAALRVERSNMESYERDLIRFARDHEAYCARMMEITELTNRAEDYLKAREVIQALKVSVKSHLLPSLNKVASVLLSQMTGGERYLVEVDEDFEIMIDGQAINTLSGSGKAVANLAIRIALGQILTNRVFSVFLADEVDAAMDDERADHTAEALRRLKDTVGQVILVTHKRPETDHMVELKKS